MLAVISSNFAMSIRHNAKTKYYEKIQILSDSSPRYRTCTRSIFRLCNRNPTVGASVEKHVLNAIVCKQKNGNRSRYGNPFRDLLAFNMRLTFSCPVEDKDN